MIGRLRRGWDAGMPTYSWADPKQPIRISRGSVEARKERVAGVTKRSRSSRPALSPLGGIGMGTHWWPGLVIECQACAMAPLHRSSRPVCGRSTKLQHAPPRAPFFQPDRMEGAAAHTPPAVPSPLGDRRNADSSHNSGFKRRNGDGADAVNVRVWDSVANRCSIRRSREDVQAGSTDSGSSWRAATGHAWRSTTEADRSASPRFLLFTPPIRASAGSNQLRCKPLRPIPPKEA